MTKLQMRTLFVFFGLGMIASTAHGQTLVWSDEFDGPGIDRSIWTFNTGGSGFGNGELQYYTARPENAFIENGSLVIEARREAYLGDKQFTSSRLLTNGRFAFKYGTIEARIKLPDVDYGIWPAFWIMGTSHGALDWPYCGELDIMEFGKKDGYEAGVVNQRVSSAAHWDDGGEHLFDYAYTDRPAPMYQNYHLFKMEWTPSYIKTYVDNDMFWSIDISDPEGDSLEEFHTPMFLLTNVAVGGWNFIEITDPWAITANFPQRMYIDYIRLFDNGDTELFYGDDNAETGYFGVFTETAPVTNHVQYEVDAALYLWNNLTETTEDAYEGSEVWSMTAAPGGWWGMGVLSTQFDRNMKNYSDGHMHLHMKTSSADTFKVGIKSTTSGESWVYFDENNSYGLVRDGEWHEVIIPLNRFSNTDFATITQIFMIAGDPSASPFEFAIDNVYWTPDVARPTPANGSFGIFTEDAAHKTAGEYELGVNGDFYIWEHTLLQGTETPYEGNTSMSLYSAPGLTWFGAAFTPTIKYNLSAFRYPESKLHFALKTSSTATFRLGMRSGNVDDIGQKWIEFAAGSNPYGFVRDGNWHIVEIPMADIIDAVDLTEVSMLFELLGVNGPITDIEFDDVCLLGGGDPLSVGAGYPVADAGEDTTLILPNNSTVLRAIGSHDLNGTIVACAWEQTSGPSTATLSGENTAILTVSDLIEGEYVFRLTVTDDDDLTDIDDVRVTVTTPDPKANAGSDQSIVLPVDSVTLAGSGTDADGVIESYLWTQVSGPSTATLTDADTATATASNLYKGTYVFDLTVTDDDGLTGNDQVSVIVTDQKVNIALGKPATASSVASTSLVTNGGFEAGTGIDADDWSLIEFAPGDAIAVSDRVNTDPYSGAWNLSLRVAGAGNGGPAAEAQQTTATDSVTPGVSYDLEARIKAVGTFGAGVVAQIALQWVDTDNSHGGGVKGATGFVNIQNGLTNEYSLQGFTDLVAPAGSDAAIVMFRMAGGAFAGSDGEIAVDSVILSSDGAYNAEFAVDGHADTSWASLPGDPQWLEISLGDVYEINQVAIDWADAYAQQYDIETSNDGSDWTTVYSTTTGAGGTETIDLFSVGRYIRLYANAGGTANGCSLHEFKVYGQLQPGDIDGDEDVDMDDFDLLADCLTGPAAEILPGCHAADLDKNARVDLRDFAKLQAAFAGSN